MQVMKKRPNGTKLPKLHGVLTRSDVASMLGVSTKTVENWRAAGLLPDATVVLGRRRYWKPSVIEKFMDR